METDQQPIVQPNLWTLLRNKRATDAVSLKTLQRFVLSLNRSQLAHIIDVYLQSVLSSNDTLHGETLRERAKTLKNQQKSVQNTVDTEILSKMNEKYGKKQSKKILKIIQQKQDENRHILSMNPEVLAYSFQYLSFRESCKVQTVCSYFVYLMKTYRGLSNYFINLNQKFWKQMFKNKINLDTLTHLKHIKIASSYCCYPKEFIFREILKLIVKKSFPCLDVLEIDITRDQTLEIYGKCIVLDQLLSQFEYIPIKKLIWSKDPEFHRGRYQSDEFWQSINRKLKRKCPNLRSFVFGINDFGTTYSYRRCPLNPPDSFGKHVASLISGFDQLQILDLFCPTWNVFKDQVIIALIANKLKNLQKLFIVSGIESSNEVNIETNKINHLALRELKTEFVVTDRDFNTGESVTSILKYLFSTFIGVEEFQFGSTTRTTRTLDSTCHISPLAVRWHVVFGTLFREKRIFSMHHGAVRPLKCINFDQISQDDAALAMGSLLVLKDEKYFDLKEFSLNVHGQQDKLTVSVLLPFGKFINAYFIPFINGFELTTVKLSCGDGSKLYCWHKFTNWCRNWIERTAKVKSIQPEIGYCDPIINILSNLPKSLLFLQLGRPKYQKGSDVWKEESMKLVRKLSKMLSKKEGNLEQIILDKVDLPKEARDYLIFMFGYNNGISINHKGRNVDQYSLRLK